MTHNKRTQFMTLEAVGGFISQAVGHKDFPPRANMLSVQIKTLVERMKHTLGKIDSRSAAVDMSARHEQMEAIIHGELEVGVYLNAIMELVEFQTRHTPVSVKADWKALFDKLADLYMVFDEDMDEVDAMKEGTRIGELMWEAATGNKNEPVSDSIGFQLEEPGIHPSIPVTPTDMVGKVIRQHISSPKSAQGIVDM